MTVAVRATPGRAHDRTSGWLVAHAAHARRVPSPVREAFAEALAGLAGQPGAIVIRTCHRVELYAIAGAVEDRRLAVPPPGTDRLGDADAARHLISVACGLDSAVLGEDQILHQIRETLEDRRAAAPLDPVLDRLFQSALRAGRIAHGWFEGPPRSLADVGLDRLGSAIGGLEGKAILIVGAGRMARLAARAAASRGAEVTIANRTPAQAIALARDVDGRGMPLGDGLLGTSDGALVAIAGAWQVGPVDRLALVDSRVAVVDLSSPPALPEELRHALGPRFISVDDLAEAPGAQLPERLARRLEQLVSDTGREFCRWLRSREAVPAMHAMTAAAEMRRQAELAWLRGRLHGVGQDEWDAVEQMTHRLVAALMHAPLSALRADEAGELEAAARQLFDV